jgi:hypothetical protein
MDRLFCGCHRTQYLRAKAGEQAESLEPTVLPMRAKKHQKVIDHSGSTFESFLEEEGTRKPLEAVALGGVREWTSAEVSRLPKEN